MNALFAADWLALVAFAAGALLGLGAGWLMRGWREADRQDASKRADRQRRAEAAPPLHPASARPAPARSAPGKPLVMDDADDADADAIGPMILLIDDRLEMLGVHAAYLRKHGYRTLMAESGTTGLQFARAYRPTLIVLDHSMPDRTGLDVARELKADPATASIPILLMTALSYGAIGMAAIEAGCAAFLPKPIEPSRLLREIVAHTPKH